MEGDDFFEIPSEFFVESHVRIMLPCFVKDFGDRPSAAIPPVERGIEIAGHFVFAPAQTFHGLHYRFHAPHSSGSAARAFSEDSPSDSSCFELTSFIGIGLRPVTTEVS